MAGRLQTGCRMGKMGTIRLGISAVFAALLAVSPLPHASAGNDVVLAAAKKPEGEAHASERRHPVSPYVQAMIDGQGGSTVIVLVPRVMTMDEETAKRYAFKLKIGRDSYTAILRDGETDIVIVGTSTVHPSTDDGAGSDADDYVRPYEEFDDGRGGTISFGYHGYDYQVEFYCRDMSAPATRPTCIDAGAARAFVQDLLG